MGTVSEPGYTAGLNWLAQRARVSPAHPAIIHGDQSWSYHELDLLADDLAGRLYAAGIRAGQQVAVLLPNCPQFVFLIHALVRIGARLVPLNVRLGHDELGWQLRHSESRWLIYSESEVAGLDSLSTDRLSLLAIERLPDPVVPDPSAAGLDEPFAILYTSGTTGYPKGVVQTLGNHLWSAISSAFRLGTLPSDRWLLSIPLYHVGGLAIPLRCCLYGTTVVIPASQGRFEASSLLDELHRHSVSLVSVVPTMLQRLLDYGRPLPASLRLILLGGAAAPPKLLKSALERRWPVACTYGLTETTSQAATALPEETSHKPGSVGKPMFLTEISIHDDQDQALPQGKVGEIVVAGPAVMQAYFNAPEDTAQALRNGRLHTGDLGYVDADGDLWVLQRRSDLIVSGGENVYPAEIERVLLEHPAIQQACVVGVPDPEWGQRVAVALVFWPGENLEIEELQEYCRGHMAGFKIPRLVRVLSELPQTASGKVRYEAVRRLWS